VRDGVVSGGDLANVPRARLETFGGRLLDVDNIRDIRLAAWRG
jgi:lysine 2,3-aminomutase